MFNREMNKTVSIIVPIYKVEKYLPKCIESLIIQSYQDIEIILVDDGSPDASLEICNMYAEKDSRIMVIHQHNSGVSAARNAGLVVAKGEYIGFVDPDDWIDTEMYEGMINAIEREGTDLAICGYDYYNEKYIVDENRQYKILPNEVITQKEVMNRFSDMPPSIRHGVWNKLFRKSILKNQTFEVGLHSSEDVLFLNEYVKKIKSAVVVHQPYYKNLVRQGSATHGGLDITSLADSFTAHDQMYQSIVQLYPELKNHSLAFLLDVCVLKYNEAKRKLSALPEETRKQEIIRLLAMRKYIKKRAWQALFDNEIYWKTRISYLIMK